MWSLTRPFVLQDLWLPVFKTTCATGLMSSGFKTISAGFLFLKCSIILPNGCCQNHLCGPGITQNASVSRSTGIRGTFLGEVGDLKCGQKRRWEDLIGFRSVSWLSIRVDRVNDRVPVSRKHSTSVIQPFSWRRNWLRSVCRIFSWHCKNTWYFIR